MRRLALGVLVISLVCASAQGEPSLDRVASLVRAGHHTRALRAVESLPKAMQEQDDVRYLRGRLLLEAARPCDAMEVLALTPSSLPEPLRLDSLRRWARAAARCGRCEEARPVLLGAVSSEVAVTLHDRAIAADCAVQMGDTKTAVEELARLTRRKRGLPNRVTLLALLSELYVRLGRDDEARESALEAWKAAVSPAQWTAVRRLEPRADPSLADRIERAQRLMDARRYARAVEELEAIDVGDDPSLRSDWLHTYGMALFRMRTRYLEAARVLHASASLGGRHAVEDAFHSARALSRADQDPRAIRAYRRFAMRHPKSRRAPQARFLSAWLELRLGRHSGEAHMQRLIRGKSQVRGRWRRAALWELGFRAFETRRYARAARYLNEYTRLATKPMDEARGYYWLGRAYRRGPKAVEAYRQAIDVEPLHWYAVLAAGRLKRLRVEPPAPFENASEPGTVELPEEPVPVPDTFEAYRRLGLDLDGIAWLRANENDLVADFPKGQRIPALARLYRDIGAHRDALRTVRKRWSFLHTDPTQQRWWWEAAYPMPWLEQVNAHRARLPRALVYATMRQESGFRPEVVSRAGAVGLMQVMPRLATRLTGKPVTRAMLRVPETNIRLGLREMNALARELDYAYPLSIAAYNAGKSRVKRWLAESGKMELDRFVERIPFNETRNYVRRVSTHYARYAYLDDPKSGWPRLPRFVKP